MTPTKANEVDLELGIIPPIPRSDPAPRTRPGDEQERERTETGSVHASVGSAIIPQVAHDASRSQSLSGLIPASQCRLTDYAATLGTAV